MKNLAMTTVIGHLAADPELKQLANGQALLKARVAVNEGWPDGKGGFNERVSFFKVVVFGKTAERASEKLIEGTPVLVVGKLRQERWEKDGQKRQDVVIVAETINALKNGTGNGHGKAQAAEAPASGEAELAATGTDDVFGGSAGEDIPF